MFLYGMVKLFETCMYEYFFDFFDAHFGSLSVCSDFLNFQKDEPLTPQFEIADDLQRSCVCGSAVCSRIENKWFVGEMLLDMVAPGKEVVAMLSYVST